MKRLTLNIFSGTLYGRCKREGIELSRSNPTPWSEDAMGEALEAVRYVSGLRTRNCIFQ